MKTVIEGLNKSFNNHQVLFDINLTIDDNEFVVLIGPSGCGKTTLLKSIAGFIEPTDGKILMDGNVVASSKKSIPPNKRNLSMVFQYFALWPHYTVEKQIQFPLHHHKFLPEWMKSKKDARVDEVLNMVGLLDFKTRYPHELSGGQKQRVALARAIAPQPGLLLMDEPLSSLDAHLKIELRNEIKNIAKNIQSSFLYVTHDQQEALSLADKVVVMKDGRIEQVGSPNEVFESPMNAFVATFVGNHNLIRGQWEGDRFLVSGVEWIKGKVHTHFKDKNIIPMRPDELKIDRIGIEGTVTSVFYQGHQFEITVCSDQGDITVYDDKKVNVGDGVFINQV